MGDELGDHRIVVGRNLLAGLDAGSMRIALPLLGQVMA